MKNTTTTIFIVLIALIAVGTLGYLAFHKTPLPTFTKPATTTTATTHYECGKGSIDAVYGDKEVALTLSDGRQLTLPQVQSGSGIRYEQGSYTFVSKGSDAFFVDNGVTTYTACIEGTNTPAAAGAKTFTDSAHTFSFMYPKEFTVQGGGPGLSQDWATNSTQMGMVLARVDLPGSLQPKTNFADARFIIGTSADPKAVASCTASEQGITTTGAVTINGTQFTRSTFADAGAGNFYETTRYRVLRNSQCYNVEYTIHSTNIGNYSPEQGITEFDKQKIVSILNSMVQSFTFL